MGTYKRIQPTDITSRKSTLEQLIDVVQADISGSSTRQKYQVFVTGGIGSGVTSSLFQTVYDQDFSLQTANPIVDMTVGLFISSSVVMVASTSIDTAGKSLFPSNSLMMREKINIYREYAQLLKGDAGLRFYSPPNSTTESDAINNALFLSFKRLFARDRLKRESFAMRFYTTGAYSTSDVDRAYSVAGGQTNLNRTSTTGSMIITDLGAASNQTKVAFGGAVGALVNASDTNLKVGLIYYDQGIAMLDLDKVLSGTQHCSGTISAMEAASTIGGATIPTGQTVMGALRGQGAGNPKAKFIPDFLVSGSIDDIVNHIASCRFQSGSAQTAMTFQNQTNINSTLVFCRMSADEFNYSSNPTFTNSEDRIVVIETGQENRQRTFTMPTAIGLYDANSNLLAIAKMSRPIEKNDEKDITFRVRLDF
jgi:hypothetical protein